MPPKPQIVVTWPTGHTATHNGRALTGNGSSQITIANGDTVAVTAPVVPSPAPPTPPIPPAPLPTTTPFLSTSKINTPIPASPPIHPDSDAMTAKNPDWVIPVGDPAYPYREWIGPRGDAFLATVDSSTPLLTVTVNYDDQTGEGCGKHVAAVKIPAQIQTAIENATLQNPNNYGWLVDSLGNAYEPGYLTAPGQTGAVPGCPTNRWNALRCDYWPTIEKTGNGYGTTYGISASHIQIGAGLIRPEDLARGLTFGHVLKIKGNLGADGATAGHPKWVGPANGGDGRIAGTRGIPYGARLQLDPSIDVTTWPSVVARKEPWLVIILRTLQVYGAIVVDSGGWERASGGLDAADPASVAPFVFPWTWGYENGVPYDLMSRFRVIDWNKWT